jgi:hypothetical protein
MVRKEVFVFSLEVELDDVEATRQFNQLWESSSGVADGPEVSRPDDRELASRAAARLVAQAFTSQRRETGLSLRSLRVMDL